VSQAVVLSALAGMPQQLAVVGAVPPVVAVTQQDLQAAQQVRPAQVQAQ
jgi:hypothetical protein